MGPIDYLSAMPQQDLLRDIQGGLQIGSGIRQIQQQEQAQANAQAAAQQYQADVQAALSNPTPQAFSSLALKYPGQREAIKQSWDGLSEADRKSEGDTMAQAYSALLAGKPEIAKQVVQGQIDARKNAGLDTSHYASALELLNSDPQKAQGALGFTLSHVTDPKTFAAQFGALGAENRSTAQAPSALREANAKADKAVAEAQVATATTPQQIQKATIDNQIAELDAQIRVANSQTERDKLQLERDKLAQQQSEKATDQGQAAQGQLDTAQQALDTVKRLSTDPLLESSFGVGSAIGKLASYIPGTANKDYRAQLETLKAQLFLPAVAQLKAAGGGGALSDAEGKKLSAAVAALDADMSPKAFKNALGVVQKYLDAGYQKALASKKLPTSGGAFVVKHPTFGSVNEGDINRLLKMYPGATREQVMSYLQSTGGK